MATDDFYENADLLITKKNKTTCHRQPHERVESRRQTILRSETSCSFFSIKYHFIISLDDETPIMERKLMENHGGWVHACCGSSSWKKQKQKQSLYVCHDALPPMSNPAALPSHLIKRTCRTFVKLAQMNLCQSGVNSNGYCSPPTGRKKFALQLASFMLLPMDIYTTQYLARSSQPKRG